MLTLGRSTLYGLASCRENSYNHERLAITQLRVSQFRLTLDNLDATENDLAEQLDATTSSEQTLRQAVLQIDYAKRARQVECDEAEHRVASLHAELLEERMLEESGRHLISIRYCRGAAF